MGFVKKAAIAVIGFFVIAIGIGAFLGSSGSYQLSVINTGSTPATITISHAKGEWTVPAGVVQTITVDKQDTKNTAVQVSIARNGATETVEGIVHFGNTYTTSYWLDITGASCLVGVDFGGLYQTEVRPLRIIAKHGSRGERWLEEPALKAADGTAVPIRARINTPLPAQYSFAKGDTPAYGEWLMIPCPIAADQSQLSAHLLRFSEQ